MSLADEARTLRERVAARLAELEPLVREYQELQRVAAELGLTTPEPTSSTSEKPAAPPAAPAGEHQRARPAAPRRRQARRGQGRASAAAERERVLEAVAAKPGATVAEIAEVVGVDAVSLYRPVRDLASAGKVVKRGRGLYPASD